ncbi:MAG: alpha-amylase family glycosyl hydrolase [Bacteroidales bacterium]|nr:alpha-amylase family glycosyl hydrolase [Lachnoclostridium sp.]MCM1383069.1 alpha-amylase family glycosyl hydrolase [Lachnoclostridium sp.]MCM1463876.1 alpha-amylase family glycosyl hydrolase [Bacteroidales bacterium]
MTENRLQIKPYPLGAHCEAGRVRFSFVSKKGNCGIILYDRQSGRRLRKIAFTAEERIGNVHCKYLEGLDTSAITYQFYEDDCILPDEHARVFVAKGAYGRERNVKDLKAGFLKEDFAWEGDKRPKIPYENCICYCMHVRGFTRHPSSKVAHRGTFLGVKEKIPYLKELGITTVELQPAYEFLEIPSVEERRQAFPYGTVGTVSDADMDRLCPKQLNYWGYKKGYYYAPKASYAAGEDASLEFKEMVKAFHANGMEVVMQFYFPNEVERRNIQDILQFWVLQYHVDGFHLMGENIPTAMLAKDPVFADTKLWYYSFDTDTVYKKDEVPAYRNLAEYRDDYLYVMRKYLKGDENMIKSVLYQMRANPLKTGYIHYLSNYYGLTMMDMVSYNRKHNEDNGEDNRDGASSDYSWNCGEEGISRRKRIRKLRRQQLKNAVCMLFLGQSTPLLFMGDEFGNSQKGNNNPYCQDNDVTWLKWTDLEKNRDIYEFFVQMIRLRREHPILHCERELKIMDSLSCGYPDLSYHGQNAWRVQTESYSRQAGVMYCGKYAKTKAGEEDDFFYLAMNMYWEPQGLALPKLPKGMKWKKVFCTEESAKSEEFSDDSVKGAVTKASGAGWMIDGIVSEGISDSEQDSMPPETVRLIPARAISLFMSVSVPEKKPQKKKSVRKTKVQKKDS